MVSFLEKLRKSLQGWKTFIIAGGAICGVLVGWIEGTIPTDEATKLIVGALMAMSLAAKIERKG